MRDPRRINRVVELLRAYWHAHPDMRLGQIIVNLTPNNFHQPCLCGHFDVCPHLDKRPDPFHVEDDKWEEKLREELRKIAKDNK